MSDIYNPLGCSTEEEEIKILDGKSRTEYHPTDKHVQFVKYVAHDHVNRTLRKQNNWINYVATALYIRTEKILERLSYPENQEVYEQEKIVIPIQQTTSHALISQR